MHLFLKLISSFWFWLDVALSISGGVVVWWGLRIEKKAEKAIPPDSFRKDIFEDVVDAQKSEIDRGWRILMRGIVMEVVAALGISIISGLEIADLTDKSAAANLEAKQAGKDAAAAKLIAANTESNNLVLRSNVAVLEIKLQDRTITPEQREKFIAFLKDAPKGPIKMGTRHADRETLVYSAKILMMLKEAGYEIESVMNYPDNLVPQNGESDVLFLIDTYKNAPPYTFGLIAAFQNIGFNPTSATNIPNRNYSPIEGMGISNKLLIIVTEKP